MTTPTTKRPRSHTDGMLVVDKPTGWTSHDVVGRCRRIVGQKRIGHAGTLDPGATGVLLVGLGRAARLMRFMSSLHKFYVGEVVLGTTTNTLDDEGEVTGTFDVSSVTLADVQTAAKAFVGDIEQIPPMVSAVQIDGKRLHELARAGIEVERRPRPVTVYDLSVEATDEPNVFRMSVECSSGTYVRTLADDIGRALGGGAHLRRLRRTAIGPHTVDNAVIIDALEENWQAHLMSPASMVSHLLQVTVDDETSTRITQGKPTDLDLAGGGPWSVVNEQNELVAVYEMIDGKAKSAVVLAD